jgi:drug/metabolite transporter (DMT)-like permease
VGTLVRAIPALTPIELVTGRLLFALAGALPVLAFPIPRAQLADAARQRTSWLLAALLAAYYLLAVPAFRLAPVADVALLLATTPLCALGLRRLRGARATRAERTGALLALAGVALTLVPSLQAALARTGGAAGAATGARLLGDLLALTAAVASAGYALTFRAAQQRGEAPAPFGVAVLTFALGATLAALPALARGAPLLPLDGLDARGTALLATLGIVSTMVPSFTVAVAARRLPPVLSTATTLLIPVVSALAAALALGERPSLWLLPGGALVAVGLLRLITSAAPAGPPAAE